ncbi:MAG: TonB family protein [Polyangiaceae bacterium]|nr:TonB family protein [Polyangiaceae bacterium]
MLRKSVLAVGSLVFHTLAVLSFDNIEVKQSEAATPIEIIESAAPEPTQEPPPPEPPTPEPPKPEVARTAPPPLAKAQADAPPPEADLPPANPNLSNLPDLGLALSGGGEGGPGLAVGRPASANASEPQVVRKPLAPPRPAVGAECSEPATKPKPISVPQPAYTSAARAAAIEGKVRIRLTVDATGAVQNVELISGLGYGLDEAAIAAAKSAQFSPAIQCGKPTVAVFTIAMRFSAS